MGKSAKRYISIITVFLVMFMPMNAAFAAISSMFNHTDESQAVIEIAVNYQNTHDGLELIVDGVITFVDDSVVHDLLFSDNSHDNQGSGGVSVSIFTQIISSRADWNHVYLDDGATYELTSVTQPAEIRPPIYF